MGDSFEFIKTLKRWQLSSLANLDPADYFSGARLAAPRLSSPCLARLPLGVQSLPSDRQRTGTQWRSGSSHFLQQV